MTSSTLPSSVPVFRRVLVWSSLVAAAVALVGGVAGVLVAGLPGLWSALVAAALTLFFAAVTVLSLILAARLDTMFFFAVVLGAWMLKFVVFLAVLALIKDAGWIHPVVLWACLLAAVIGTLAVDVMCVLKARVSHVSDVRLPGE